MHANRILLRQNHILAKNFRENKGNARFDVRRVRDLSHHAELGAGERDRERERQTDRQTETGRERGRQRETE